tara:strand:- start:302289 stop:302792 length:504 start_codon:yes stop_codon:yes gene_type:complete
MTISGNQLLSALGSGILPGGNLDASNQSAQKHDTHLDFNEVLRRVQNGQASELGVKIGKGVSPQSMTNEVRDRVGIASDRAVVKGINQALVDLGESFVRVDVRNRVIEAQFEPSDGGVIEGIDGYVSMRPIKSDEVGAESGIHPIQSVSARVVRNQSLADVLSSITP